MIQWFSDVFQWLSDLFTPFIEFFKSTVHGLQLMINMFPKVLNLSSSAIGYLPSIFATFITISIIIYIVYLIIGRNAGGSE